LVFGWLLPAHQTAAQDTKGKDESRIRIVIARAEPFRKDIKSIIELAPGNLKKQAQNVDDNLEPFQEGVEPEKPIGIDVIFAPKETLMQLIVPVIKLQGKAGFIGNIQGFQYKVAGPDNTGLYTITERAAGGGAKKATPKIAGKAAPKNAPAAPAKPHYMRESKKYAIISPRQSDVPANFADPLPDLKKIIGEHDLAVRIENDAKSLEKRRANFDEYRDQIEAAIKFKRGEAEADFEMRRLAAKQQLAEAERFLIESQLIDIGWTTDMKKKDGHGDLRLEALPKTSLEDSIQLLVQESSYFANVELHKHPAIALKANFAIDDLRTEHAKALYEAMRPVAKLRIEDRPKLTDDGKKAANEAFNKLLDMFEDARQNLKLLDMVIDLHAAKEKHTLVCGIRVVDGTKAVELIELMPKIREGWAIKTDIEEHGGVKIHSIGIAEHRLDEFKSLFAGEPIFYIGTSEKVVWGAAGENALDELKAAIDATQKEAPAKVDPEFFSLKANFGPLVELASILRSKEPKKVPEDKDEKAAQDDLDKQLKKIKKFAEDSFGGCDVALQATLRRDGDVVIGEMSIQECVLQFLGSAVANWAAENLQ